MFSGATPIHRAVEKHRGSRTGGSNGIRDIDYQQQAKGDKQGTFDKHYLRKHGSHSCFHKKTRGFLLRAGIVISRMNRYNVFSVERLAWSG